MSSIILEDAAGQKLIQGRTYNVSKKRNLHCDRGRLYHFLKRQEWKDILIWTTPSELHSNQVHSKKELSLGDTEIVVQQLFSADKKLLLE